ncbi:hypothetical protein ABL78_6582 [Leptomonas seymouri]|uniref:Uncharacterized protein n=1 Tax=Leptomonas seymouri TaxID=5684 RepID=A0A0N1PCV4_LEPSE|nr:hypothetical protein ABL78_6582 [Leptomonas seymouri]|eukprot:KPI84375.1 hypothetical protein ABL78_6582 [Leptomonas seymouri]
MDRASSPPPSLPTITVALCGSAKKHQQSFDALREAGERHNTRLRAEQERYTSGVRTVRFDPNARLSASLNQPEGGAATSTSVVAPSRPKSRSGSRRRSDEANHSTAPADGCSPRGARNLVNNYFFSFVNLNYDVQHHNMVVCTDASIKGEQPPKSHAENEDATGTTMYASDAAAAEAARLAGRVDAVLHKVATFGSPSAVRALERWCKQAQKCRSRRRQAPLIVLDPLEKVQLLMTRSMLYKLLDNTSADGRCVALIPRTFMWDRPGAQRRAVSATVGTSNNAAAAAVATIVEDAVATPLGIHSFMALDDDIKEARTGGSAQGRWWIAKPDEGTGPAFTHHLVMWCTRGHGVRVPPAVQAALPKEASRFILQELYVHALPVVIKVYCIAPHIYIKVNPTVNLLAHLWECTRGSTMMDAAVMIDSQDKAFFSAVTSMSGATSGSSLSQATSSANYGAVANERSTPPLVSSPHPADPAAVPWESMIAPGEWWDAFLAPGTPAHTAVSRLAQEMSGFGGIGLAMYGFDLVLVPQHLAHAYQRKSSRGIGHTEGATVKYETAAAANSSAGVAATAASWSTALPSAPLPFKACEMFDLATGAPTPLLLGSIPVVIDVNYFPGYKGVGEANQHTMELIAAKVASVKEETSPSAHRSDNASGSRDRKHPCNSM